MSFEKPLLHKPHKPLLIAASCIAFTTSLRAQAVAQETGLEALIARLGAGNQPTGSGVRVGQIEAPSPGYLPDPNHAELLGKTFNQISGASTVSGHATTVGQFYYGSVTGISPGISEIDCWDANDWLASGFLNNTSGTAPDTVLCKVMNNSWIGSGFNVLLRKLDYAIVAQGLIVCSGVNNGTGPLDVELCSHSFNGIAVGRSDGQHHAGGTLSGVDKPGRRKPEIVAPAGATSFSTPLVSGGAALLVETARTHPLLASNPVAEQPEVIKAALLAGAKHRATWTNNAATSGPTRGTTAQSLDLLYGVDQLEIDQSHWILTGGVQPSASTPATAIDVAHAGWEAAQISSGQSVFWRFEVEATKPFMSVVATWNRSVALGGTWAYTIPDCDLELWSADALGNLTTLVGDPGLPFFGGGNVRSASNKDNVEHLYVTGLQPGDYALELRRTVDALGPWSVAVAWEIVCPEGLAYGTGKTTSASLEARLEPRGIPSESVDEFFLRIGNGLPNVNGLVFYGSASAALPFFGGTRWVASPVQRMPVVQLDANGALDVHVDIDAAMIGTTRFYQFWFRDPPHPDGTTVGLTNGVEVTFCR